VLVKEDCLLREYTESSGNLLCVKCFDKLIAPVITGIVSLHSS